MSLYELPVSVSDLTGLQQAIEFAVNIGEATTEAAAINAPGFPSETVGGYAASLLEANLSTSQVAMAVGTIAEGATLGTGSIVSFATKFLPDQVAYANTHGLNPTVYAGESLGLALAGTTGFQNTWAGLSTSAFETQASAETGVNTNALDGWLKYWTGFYTANPDAAHGLTAMQAAYGATLGDAIGTGLLNFTTTNTIGGLKMGIVPGGYITGGPANALIDIAEGTYKVGLAGLADLPHHSAMQGEIVV